MNNTLYASFCGTGKSYLCEKYPETHHELECWKYRDSDFPSNYIEKIKQTIDSYTYLFISTDPIVLNELHSQGYKIVLIYPQKSLKNEYIDRYKRRGSHKDFIETLDKFWYKWLSELSSQKNYEEVILEGNMFLEDILKNKGEIELWQEKR